MNKKETPGSIPNETKGEIIKKLPKNNKNNQTNNPQNEKLFEFFKNLCTCTNFMHTTIICILYRCI